LHCGHKNRQRRPRDAVIRHGDVDVHVDAIRTGRIYIRGIQAESDLRGKMNIGIGFRECRKILRKMVVERVCIEGRKSYQPSVQIRRKRYHDFQLVLQGKVPLWRHMPQVVQNDDTSCFENQKRNAKTPSNSKGLKCKTKQQQQQKNLLKNLLILNGQNRQQLKAKSEQKNVEAKRCHATVSRNPQTCRIK
jgi:hypothetical protein